MSKKKLSQNPILKASDITVRFGAEAVLEGVSFQVERGEFIGLIGPNGSGKSTLLKVLLGLMPPSEGSFAFTSKVIFRYVPQQYVLPANVPLSVQEVIQMGSRLSVQVKDIVEILAKVGMAEEKAFQNFHDLSGGQKQRVIIARALIDRPDMIFFDEPLSGVDQATKMHIYKLLKALNTDGMTIFFVSHDIDHVIDTCDRVLCLDRTLHRGCHPQAFSEGQRNRKVDTEVDAVCLVDDLPKKTHKKPMHHHH